jgi:tetratricopeptide (TPR) repeat protein
MKFVISTLTILLLGTGLVLSQERNAYLSGMAELKQEKYTAAIESFSVSIANADYPEKCYLSRGIAYLNLGEFKNAEADFNRLKDFNQPKAILWLSRLHAHQNNPQLSMRLLREYLLLQGSNFKREVLNYEAYKTIHYSREWQDFVVELPTDENEELIRSISYHKKRGSYREAIDELNNIIYSQEPSADLLLLRGELLGLSGNWELALNDYFAALEKEPENSIIIHELAKAYSQNREYLKAEELYAKLLVNEPDNFDVYRKHARAALLADKPDKAIQSLTIYQQYFPEEDNVRYELAKAYFHKEEYGNALKEINPLMSKHTIQPEWYLLRGNCYLKTGTIKYAAADFSMCLDMEPNNPVANLNLGTAQLRMGKIEKACFYWERAQRAGELKATEFLMQYCN